MNITVAAKAAAPLRPFGADRGNQPLAAGRAPTGKHPTTPFGLHPSTEAVLALAPNFAGLIRAFQNFFPRKTSGIMRGTFKQSRPGLSNAPAAQKFPLTIHQDGKNAKKILLAFGTLC
jgi:hypothetical protein